MKISNKLKALVIAGAVVVAGAAGVVPAQAKVVCESGDKAGQMVNDVSECTGQASSSDLMGTLNTIISVVIGIVGFLAVVMIILGGISYTTSAGDASKVKKAKDTIMYGIIGLVIALLAFAIVNFVLVNVF